MVQYVKASFCSNGKLCFVFGVFLVCSTHLTDAQRDCDITAPDLVEFSETAPANLSLLNLTGGPSAQWDLDIVGRSDAASQGLIQYFRLEQAEGNATIYLDRTLDLEEANVFLESNLVIELSIKCSQPGEKDVSTEWFVSVLAVNEFAPKFVSLPEGGFNISEAEKVGDIILVLQGYVEDEDVTTNPQRHKFTLLPYSDATVDGRETIALANIYTGALTPTKELDYEAMDPAAAYYMLEVFVDDMDGLNSTGSVRINILDADDQPPEFWHPDCPSPCFTYYSAAIRDSFQGDITWLEPAAIAARDLDTLESPVTYRLKQGDPKNFAEYLSINQETGVPTILKPVADTDADAFFVIVEAVEDTPLKHSQQTNLWLKIIGRNTTDPTLPPLVIEDTSAADAFRIATIVLGVLFGLLLVIFVIFLVCTLKSSVLTSPVLPKAIGKLSSEDGQMQGGTSNASNSTRRKSRKSVTLAKDTGESRLDFMRSLSRTRRTSPTLKSYTSTTMERESDVENLPVSREIEFDQDGVDEVEDTFYQPPVLISTISDSGVVPYEDRMGLVESSEGMAGEERMGMSNPVYEVEGEGDVETAVVPMEQSPVYI